MRAGPGSAWLGGLLVLLSAARPARAREVIVLESHGGGRAAEAERLLAPLMHELRERGFATRLGDLGAQIEEQVSGPGGPMTDRERSEVEELVEQGFAKWLRGDYAAAIDELTRAVETYRRSPATFAQDQARRDQMLKALVGVAMAGKRLGQGDVAQRAMAELIRSFPDREVGRAEYGPEAQAFYRDIKRELDQQRHGGLEINVDDDGVLVFINERYESVGDVAKPDLVPGRYRVYVQKENAATGRTHEVEVTAGATQRLVINWALDSALRTGPIVGFVFANEPQRRKSEAPLAAAVARALGAAGVVVVGVRPFEGRRAIVGTVLSIDTMKPLRTAALAIEPVEPGEEKIRGLGRFLAGEEPDPGLILTPEGAGAGASVPRGERRSHAWRWAALGAGVAVAAAGVTLIAIDGPRFDDDGNYLPKQRGSMAAGIGLAAGGAALVGTGIVLWILDARAERRPPGSGVAVVPFGAAGLSLAGEF